MPGAAHYSHVPPPASEAGCAHSSADLEKPRDLMATTEIEKLERRYAENPQGLTFAPLAEVHRKNGEVERALELLRAGLELHPNYIPASIVLGRCHWDRGDLPAAEAAFSHVLRLDDENVIALKSLADINERLERFSEAQRWLNRLISVDRSNEEARQQLARIQESKQEPSPSAALPNEIAAAGPEAAPAAASPPAEEEPRTSVAPLDLTAAIAEPAPIASGESPSHPPTPKAPILEFLDTSEPARQATEPVPPVEKKPVGDAPAQVDGLISQEFVPPKDTTYRLHPELTHDFISTDKPSDELEVETAAEVELQSSGAAEFRVPNAAEDFMEPSVAPSPPAGLEWVPLEPPPPPKRSYSARVTKGQSVASFFQAMLAARPSGPAGASASVGAGPPNAEPTRQGQDELTLNSNEEDTHQVPPAVPASGPPADAAVSFDAFFGASAGGSSSLTKGSADPGKDDLDEFQSWLQNLKR
jgi:Flp pilus assembly protein TadD